jgi:hypothetical protein
MVSPPSQRLSKALFPLSILFSRCICVSNIVEFHPWCDETIDRLVDGERKGRSRGGHATTFNSTWRKTASKYMERYTPCALEHITVYVTSWETGWYTAIGSKAGRRAKHAGNDGQAELQRERTTDTEGTCLQKLRDAYCFISKRDQDFKEPFCSMNREIA